MGAALFSGVVYFSAVGIPILGPLCNQPKETNIQPVALKLPWGTVPEGMPSRYSGWMQEDQAEQGNSGTVVAKAVLAYHCPTASLLLIHTPVASERKQDHPSQPSVSLSGGLVFVQTTNFKGHVHKKYNPSSMIAGNPQQGRAMLLSGNDFSIWCPQSHLPPVRSLGSLLS